jgi:tetratricopeptide (TPR) repeat protein
MARAQFCAFLFVALAHAGATDIQARVEEAEGHLRHGRPSEALAVLGTVVEKHPDALEAHVLYQDVMRATGRQGEITERYRTRAKEAAKDPTARYLYARLLNGNKAVSEFKAIVKIAPDFGPAWVGYARALGAQGKMKPAIEAAEKAISLDNKSPAAYGALGWLSEDSGKLDVAEDYYRRSIEVDPEFLPSRYKLAHLLVRQEKGDAALLEIEKAKEIAPGDPRVSIHEGLVLGALDRNKKAAEAYKRAIVMAPADPLILVLLAETYAELSEWSLAQRAVTRALDLNDKLAVAHAAKGYVELRQGRSKDAVGSFKQAIKLDKENATYHFYLGVAKEKLGKSADAIKSYKQACRKGPEISDYQIALGEAYVTAGKTKLALGAFKEAVELAPEDADIRIRYGHSAADARKYRDAVKAFEKALELDGSKLEAWKSMGIIYETRLNDPKQAATCYREYIKNGGKDARVNDWLEELGEG